MRHGLVGEQAEDVSEGVHHAQAGEIAGVAQVLLGDGRHVHVFDGGVRHFGRLEQAARASRRASGTLATPVRTAVEPMRVS